MEGTQRLELLGAAWRQRCAAVGQDRQTAEKLWRLSAKFRERAGEVVETLAGPPSTPQGETLRLTGRA